MESLLDRTQDFVKAAVAQRSQLGGDLCLDVNMDLAPSAAPEGSACNLFAICGIIVLCPRSLCGSLLRFLI